MGIKRRQSRLTLDIIREFVKRSKEVWHVKS